MNNKLKDSQVLYKAKFLKANQILFGEYDVAGYESV